MGSIRLMAGGFKKRPYGSKRNRVPCHSLLWIMQDCVSLGIYMWFRRGISVSGVGLGVTCKQNTLVFQDLLWPRRFAQWFNLFS